MAAATKQTIEALWYTAKFLLRYKEVKLTKLSPYHMQDVHI